MLIAPSILAADFAHLAEAVATIEKGGADWVHLDIMDGIFVPNLTFGPQMVSSLRPHTRLPFDAHLMIAHPENFIEKFAGAGADIITVHYEAAVHIHRLLAEIKSLGIRAGISLVPSTPASVLSEILSLVDLILVMTVNPGFGGQAFIPETLAKVEYLSGLKRERGFHYLIEVDGGINPETSGRAIQAGAEVLVAGSAVFESPQPEAMIDQLRGR